MLALIARALLSGAMVVTISEAGKRLPAMGALVTSLPLVAILAMILLWRERSDAAAMATFANATFWYVLVTLPMFPLIAALLRRQVSFSVSLTLGCVLTALLYLALRWLAPRLGVSI